MPKTIFRVHPAINFARVGNSDEYYIAPETAAGELVHKKTGLFGGLPIKPNTEDTPIDCTNFRDKQKRVRRQAARFRIYAYDEAQQTYPSTDQGREIKIGDCVGGKTIKDIIWSVHLANKKNNWYKTTDQKGDKTGIKSYQPSSSGEYNYPPIRNPKTTLHPELADLNSDLDDEKRRKVLVIDGGPHTIASSNNNEIIHFKPGSACSYLDPQGNVCKSPDYPVSFPSEHFKMHNITDAIDSLGELQIEKNSGRLIVTGGYGKASGILLNGEAPEIKNHVDNDYWFDDTSDGPVNAVVIFDDNSSASVVGGWVITTNPGYAPQIPNIVSTWDDVFNTWVEKLDLLPSLYRDNQYQANYKASWEGDILPVFYAASLQRWTTSLSDKAINGHNRMAQIDFSQIPSEVVPNFKTLIRDPNASSENEQDIRMPVALGDTQKSFLSVTSTQYFLLMQWYQQVSIEAAPEIGTGEKLDKVVLENCMGGRYSPGIDLPFIVRDIHLYKQNWQGENGPFRINAQVLEYNCVKKDQPFLGVGYIPLQNIPVQPGDLSKFMSQLWHTYYNSCAMHVSDPNPTSNNTLYWASPAQRPVQVYPLSLCSYDAETRTWDANLQLFSIRGDGAVDNTNLTHTNYPQDEGKYQDDIGFVKNWYKVGFIIQGSQIPLDRNENYGADKFVEVASGFTSYGDLVKVWPTKVVSKSPKKQHLYFNRAKYKSYAN